MGKAWRSYQRATYLNFIVMIMCLVNSITKKRMLVTRVTLDYFICDRVNYISKKDVALGKYYIEMLVKA